MPFHSEPRQFWDCFVTCLFLQSCRSDLCRFSSPLPDGPSDKAELLHHVFCALILVHMIAAPEMLKARLLRAFSSTRQDRILVHRLFEHLFPPNESRAPESSAPELAGAGQ